MIRNLLICLLTIFCTTQALALELTVERCVQLGLEQNEKLKAMAAEVEISTQDAKIAYTELFPSINLESAYIIRDQPPHFTIREDLYGPGIPSEDTQIEGEKDHYSVAFKLNQPLFAGGRFVRSHEGKSLLQDAQNYELENRKNQLIYQIKESFFHALTKSYELQGKTEAVAAKSEALRISKELLVMGKATRNETLVAESSLLFAKTDELQAEQAYQNALDELGTLIGSNESISIVEPALYATLSPDFETDQEQVFSDRNDMKRLNTQIRAANKNVDVARSGYYPQLNLEASYLKQRETDITEAEVWEAGLRLNWSLFEAGKTNAEVARAKAEVTRLMHIRNDLARTIENDIRAAINLVREKEALVEAHRLQVLATEQEYANQLERYHAGDQKILDVLDSRAKLAINNANYRATINQLRTAIVSLEKVLAVPLEHQLIAHEPYRPDLKNPDERPVKKTKPVPVAPSSEPEQAKVPSDNYAVQMGAFKSKERADSYLRTLRNKYSGMTFETFDIDGWWKVHAIYFSSRDSAAEALAALGGTGFIVHAKPYHR